MTRGILTLLTVLAVSALLTVPAMAQATAPIGPNAGPWGARVAPTQEQIQYLKKAQELRSDIQGKQLELRILQQQNAEQKKIEAKTKELTRLRTQLHELNVANRPALGAGAGWGFGGGPRALGGGSGAGAMHRWQRGRGGSGAHGAGFRHRAGRAGGQGGCGGWGGGAGGYCPYQTF